jgi:hypothetical protein
MAQQPPEEALVRILRDLGSQRVEDVQSGTSCAPCSLCPAAPAAITHARILTPACCDATCATRLLLPLTAASALRKHVRLSPEEAAGQLVRLTPSWSELLRAWDTLHDGHRAQDAAVPLLGALADVLGVRPGGATQAHSVLHVSLDGLARTVCFLCACVFGMSQKAAM